MGATPLLQMSLGLRKSDSFKGLGNLSSGIGARHTHGDLKEECRDFPPVLRRSPSSTAGRKFDPWIKFCGDWGNDEYTFRVNDHIRTRKDGRVSVVAAMFRKRAGDFNVSRTTVTGDILTFRLELPGTIIDWHLKYNESGCGAKTLVGTVSRPLPFSALTLTSIGLSGSFIIITQRRSIQCH